MGQKMLALLGLIFDLFKLIVVAALSIFFAFEIRLQLHPLLQNHLPLLFFIVSSLWLSLYWRVLAGIISLTISLLIAFYCFVPTYNSFHIESTGQILNKL